MRFLALLAMVAFTITCGPSPDAKLPGYAGGTGGVTSTGTGGTTDTGGTTSIGTGGITGTGGSSVVGTGGKPGNGGTPGSGGRIGPGGSTGSGGRFGADAGPDSATVGRGGAGGGAPGTGGRIVGTGGSGFGDAGGVGTGGSTKGTGGAGGLATGGTTGTRDAANPPPDSAGTCMSQVVSNGYACGNTPACSVCKDQNGNSRETGCKKAIDCLAAAGANCDSSCKQNCLNLAGDSPGMACVTALQTAACGASGCVGTPPPNGGG
jgi:hypothetical protein